MLLGIGEVEEDVLGAGDVVVVEEDAGGGGGDSLEGTVLALAGASTHEGGAGVFHDGVDILEVDVDVGVVGDDFGDTLGGGEEDVVGHAEGLRHGEVAEGTELVIVDDDDGVDMLAELLDACEGLLTAFGAFEGEGQGDDGDNQDVLGVLVVEFDALGDFGDDRCRCRRPYRR